MGEFAIKVRRNQVAGPTQKTFKRTDWENVQASQLDDDDRRIVSAGLFFDELLTFLRREKKLQELPLNPAATARIVVAIGTHHLFKLSGELKQRIGFRSDQTNLAASAVLEQRFPVPSGELFGIDELLTGFGDGAKHMLRELHGAAENPDSINEYDATTDQVGEINFEITEEAGK